MRSEGSSLTSLRGKIIDRLSGLDPRKQALVRGLQVVKSVVYRTEYMDRTLRIQSCFTGVELHYSTKRKEDALIRLEDRQIRFTAYTAFDQKRD